MKRPIILIIPPSKYSKFMKYDQFLYAPLEGITILANTLMNKLLEVEIFDCRGKDKPIDWLLSNKINENAIFGITTFFDSFKFVMELTNSIKKLYPKSLIVLGGPLASYAYRTFLENTCCDFVVLGEGELTFPSLLDVIDDNSCYFPPGIAYKANGCIRHSGYAPTLVDLDSLVDLDWDIYPNLANQSFSFSYLISRGCNRRCSYCNPMFQKIRAKSSGKVKRELQYLKNVYGLKSVILNDLNFLEIGDVSEYCKILRELDIRWSCFSRPEKLNPLSLKSLKEHGCVNIRFGIESFDQTVLDMNSRNINVEDMKETIQMAIDSGIQKITGYFILGLPSENESSLEKTVKEIEDLKGLIPRPFYLLTLPGTKVYNDALRNGLIYNELTYLISLDKIELEANDYIPVNVCQAPIPKLKETFNTIISFAKTRENNISCPITL